MNKFGRRDFIKALAASSAGAASGIISVRGTAEVLPGRIRLAHFADPMLGESDGEESGTRLGGGALPGAAHALVEDLCKAMLEEADGPPDAVVVSGGLLGSAREPALASARAWLASLPAPVGVAVGNTDVGPGVSRERFAEMTRSDGGRDSWHSLDLAGFHFVFLDTTAKTTNSGGLHDPARQLEWLDNDLAAADRPVVLVSHAPLLSDENGISARDREALSRVLSGHKRVALALCGKTLANRAGMTDFGAPCLVTASPQVFPCGFRMVDLEVFPDGGIKLVYNFIQTRQLGLVEDSFHLSRGKAFSNLGVREDRDARIEVNGGRTVRVEAMEPKPFPSRDAASRADTVTMALLADTHVCLDQYVTAGKRDEYELIGHYSEQGSLALLADVIDQVSSGVHRVEFYDEVFGDDPQNPANYLNWPVDLAVVCGDLTEHGRSGEAEIVREMLSSLPMPTLVAPGNHDLRLGDFAPTGAQDKGKFFAEFYRGQGPIQGSADYVVDVNDWLSLAVVDTTIPGRSSMGVRQDRIDGLEREISRRHDRTIIVFSHHPIYPISLVPPLMSSYLRSRSHFTPPRSAARLQLQDMFARHHNVKMAVSGHYHGVCVDQFAKLRPTGEEDGDRFTTHLQVPCLIEYPAGYCLLRVSREGNGGTIEYRSAYTRLHELRAKSGQAPLYKIMGTEVRTSGRYRKCLDRHSRDETFWGEVARLDPYDISDTNVRGFKDGTANRGEGNSGKKNIGGKVIFTS